jgi:hypothetical protein
MILLCAGVGSTLELDRHRFDNNYSPTVLSGSSFFIGRLPPVHVGNAFAVSLLDSKELTKI